MLSITTDNLPTHFVLGLKWAPVVAHSAGDYRRDNTQFAVSTESGSLVIAGTYDEICDFASEIAVRVISWAVLHGGEEWFEQSELEIIERTAQDAEGHATG